MPFKTTAQLQERFNTDLLFSDLSFNFWKVNGKELMLDFTLGDVNFQHKDRFSIDLEKVSKSPTFEKLVCFYALSKMFKHSQFFLTRHVRVHNSVLDEEEEAFWQNYFNKYSMELFFTEQIDLKNLTKLEFVKTNSIKMNDFKSPILSDNVLLGVGGGKDAIFAYELLEKSDITTDLFVTYEDEIDLRSRVGLAEKMAKKYNRVLYTLHRREFEPSRITTTIKAQKKSGIRPSDPAASNTGIRLAFVALAQGYKYITTCNEKSADFGNTEYCGIEVNHQYSKSLEFEKQLNTRLKAIFDRDINYFSILKPFYEIKIAEGFSQLKEYFPFFNSCNMDYEKWCGNCSKCAFIYALLSAFLSPQVLLEIFHENLFDKKSLERTFLELLGLVGIKPLECVGEKEEMWIALAGAIQHGHTGQVIDVFKQKILVQIDLTPLKAQYLKVYLDKDSQIIPPEIVSKVQWSKA